ncbi:MAG TPA: C4-dicarboxylate ABC transporter permease, partial [Sphaerochaeta sp.]|nr:C4-dicarboxylate ABC transporter permease [Sphaerochaeta sp.]
MLILIGSFLVMLMVKVPVLFSMGISSALYLLSNDISLMVIGQRMTTMLMSFTLLAVPFFVLLAELFNAGNSTKRLIRFVLSLVGW